MLPPFALFRNRLQIAATFVYTWAALNLVLSEVYPGYDATVALYLGAPLAGLSGVMATDVRAWRLFRSPIASFHSAYEVELKARTQTTLATNC